MSKVGNFEIDYFASRPSHLWSSLLLGSYFYQIHIELSSGKFTVCEGSGVKYVG